MEPLMIIGTGQAGYGLAREYRKYNLERPLHLITIDSGDAYYKPNLSKSFSAKKVPNDLISASVESMAVQLNAKISNRTTVRSILPKQKVIEIDDRRVPYSQLVLACGADAIIPSVTGASLLQTVNSLEDYESLYTTLSGKRSVVIVGAGLIGCELANDLTAAGFSVTVVDISPWPLARQVPQIVGEAFVKALAEMGVCWELNSTVVGIYQLADGHEIELACGRILRADLVLCAIGQRPRTTLADKAGLEVSGGIVVDEYLRTSDPNIYALGDCAKVAGRLRPYIGPITHSVKALAKTLAGFDTSLSLPTLPVVVKTPALSMILLPSESDIDVGYWEVIGSNKDLAALYRNSRGELLGFVLTGKAIARKQEFISAIK